MFKKALIAAAVTSAIISTSHAQVTITDFNTPYSQTFDSLISTDASSATYTDNVTIVGWSANSEEMDTNSDEYFAEDGTFTGGEVYSFGDASASDRAFGYIGSGDNDYFNLALRLFNDTGSTIDTIRLSYTGEQWRSGGNTSDNNNSIGFSYQTFGSGAGSVPASTSLTGWTSVASLTFTAPQTNLAAGALDGNASANQTSFSNVEITGINWADGDDLWLRFTGNDGSGTDAGLGIDDFSVVAVPEPSTALLVSLALALAFFLSSRRRVRA